MPARPGRDQDLGWRRVSRPRPSRTRDRHAVHPPAAGDPRWLPPVPARRRSRAQPARHQGLRAHDIRGARPLCPRDPWRRRLPAEPPRYGPLHERGRGAPDRTRPRACGPHGRRAPGEDLLHDRVLRAVRPRPCRGRRGLEVPLRPVLRDRRHGRSRPRSRYRDRCAAVGCGHGSLGDPRRLPVAVLWAGHGHLPRGDRGAPAGLLRARGPGGRRSVSSNSGGSRGRCCGRRRSRSSC